MRGSPLNVFRTFSSSTLRTNTNISSAVPESGRSASLGHASA